MRAEQDSQFVKQIAASLGFDRCGIAPARRLDEDARRLDRWLSQGMHGSMDWMENHFELRVDPRRLVPGARSVITLLVNYFPSEMQPGDSPRVAKYAYGEDYHEVIRPQLRDFLARLRERFGEIQGRGFVDSAPVLERSWAVESGLGWVGKNGNLITRDGGSFFFIATLITDLPLAADTPFPTDHCGTCTRCVDACPTEAIQPDKTVDGSRCISYFTIELRDQLIPEEMRGKFDNWLFGCDTCQDVCPWNRFSVPAEQPAFRMTPAVDGFSEADWEALTEEGFRIAFRHSPIRRAKFEGIRRNLRFLQAAPKPPED